jgi:hypothetical protein
MTPAAVRIEFTLTHVHLFGRVRFRRRFSLNSGFRRWWSLSQSDCRTQDRSQDRRQKGRLREYSFVHFDLPFQAGNRNR